MASPKETTEAIAKWLAEEWGRSFSGVLETMADQKVSIHCDGVSRPWAAAEGATHSEQEFSLGPGCVVRLSVPELVWREAGTRVLQAAGIEEVGQEDALSTFQEVLSQTFSGLAQSLGARLGREVTCTARQELDSLPENTSGLSISLTLQDAEIADQPVFVSPADELLQQLQQTGAQPAAGSEAPPAEEASRTSQSVAPVSKTFDLLLGVDLPVSVSFGKTSMMVKEVLKLTTGSIVELNRAVSEPVDIIVNNCIIARGDVVVVSGNYGVRVCEIVSREQRYQTGMRPVLPLNR